MAGEKNEPIKRQIGKLVPMEIDESAMFYAESKAAWRQWLIENHETAQMVWLVHYKKSAKMPTLEWSDAVDEALCFGWIDSTRKTLDKDRFAQFFTRRKPRSVWSKINKEKIERLTAEGLMYPAGLAAVEIAKQNGQWTLIDHVEDMVMADDFAAALKEAGGMDFFESQSNSMKKQMFHWIATAKRPETRAKRIEEIASHAGEGKRHPRYIV